MKIGDVMTPCPHRLDANASLPDALKLMKLRQIRHLPIVDRENVVGVLSEREALLSQSICEISGHCPNAGSLCAKDPFVVEQSEDVAKIARAMSDRKVDCALISDEQGNLVGIFTTTDACRVIYLMLGNK